MVRKIVLTVKPNAASTKIKRVSDSEYVVAVRAPAENGKANRAVIELLADYFSVPKSAIKVMRGEFARKKLIEIGR